jgi:hypothetical protein
MSKHPTNRVYLEKRPSARVLLASEFGSTPEGEYARGSHDSQYQATGCKACLKECWDGIKLQWIAIIVLFILTLACSYIFRWTHEQGYTPDVGSIPWLCLVAAVAFIMLFWTEEAFDFRKCCNGGCSCSTIWPSDGCKMLQLYDLRITYAVILIWLEAIVLMTVFYEFQILPGDEGYMWSFYITKLGPIVLTLGIFIYLVARICCLAQMRKKVVGV